MRIGIYGGSFNPVHTGHIIFADAFRRQCSLDHCLLIPASLSPFKSDEQLEDDNHRVNMLFLACEELQNTSVSSIELDRGGISYTIDTVSKFKELYPHDELFILIGEDQALRFTQWKDWKEILRSAQICVIPRINHEIDSRELNILLSLQGECDVPIWLDVPFIEISSSAIREKIVMGDTIHGLIPLTVEYYILQHNLFTL